MIFADLRVRLLNWLAAPAKTKFTNAYKKEKEMSYTMNSPGQMTYTLGAGAGGISVAPSQPTININGNAAINFSVAKANGGWVVQINDHQNSVYFGQSAPQPQLYIIGEDADFDKELGKIVTMSCLKG